MLTRKLIINLIVQNKFNRTNLHFINFCDYWFKHPKMLTGTFIGTLTSKYDFCEKYAFM